jgi:predicted transcriptional regulator
MLWIYRTCTISPADWTTLEQLAKAQDRSMSSVIRQALRQRLLEAAAEVLR